MIKGFEAYASRIKMPDSWDNTSGPALIEALIEPVLSQLVVDRPLWRFKADLKGYGRVGGFTVYQDDEELGSFHTTYFSGGMKIAVSNHRIAKALARRNAYLTADPNKAVAKMRRLFSAKSTAEAIEDAEGAVAVFLNRAAANKSRLKDRAQNVYQNVAVNYILGEEGFPIFLKYLGALPEGTRAPIEHAIKEASEYRLDMLTIEDVRERFHNTGTTLVIRDGRSYILRSKDGVAVCDDSTLPEKIRGKLGMLKLVEAEQFITNTGCRVNENVYVVVDEENEA